MAGSYSDVPGYRFSYDKDGTSVIEWNGTNSSTAWSYSSMQITNASTRGAQFALNVGHTITFMFTELRNVSGFIINADRPVSNTISYSSDTTNGLDGTWTNAGSFNAVVNGGSIELRNNINSINLTNISALQVSNLNFYIYNLHLYGSIPTTNSPDRLRIVDMSGNDIAAQLDFGDIPQRNNSTKQFQVVNNSSTKTANNITITMDTNPDASPTLIGQYQLSTDNTAFANAINIGNLNPGQSSGTLYLRDTVASNAQLGPWSVRLTASANTWS